MTHVACKRQYKMQDLVGFFRSLSPTHTHTPSISAMDIPILAPSSWDHDAIDKLHDMEERDRRKVRSKLFNVRDTSTTWRSWTVREHIYKKNRNGLPTQARGLFTLDDVNAQYPIVVRGYDKFFNLHETDKTQVN